MGNESARCATWFFAIGGALLVASILWPYFTTLHNGGAGHCVTERGATEWVDV